MVAIVRSSPLRTLSCSCGSTQASACWLRLISAMSRGWRASASTACPARFCSLPISTARARRCAGPSICVRTKAWWSSSRIEIFAAPGGFPIVTDGVGSTTEEVITSEFYTKEPPHECDYRNIDYIPRHYPGAISRQHVADRRASQTDCPRHRDHHRYRFAAEIPRRVLISVRPAKAADTVGSPGLIGRALTRSPSTSSTGLACSKQPGNRGIADRWSPSRCLCLALKLAPFGAATARRALAPRSGMLDDADPA